MKRKLLSLLVLLTMAATGAKADHGLYNISMSIGGVSGDFTQWSTDSNNPTDLGNVTNLIVSSVAFNIWSDANDRGGANMFFRVYDTNGKVGSDQDLHLGTATRITGDHDFSISWTGPFDLANAVSLTFVDGNDYYVDVWVKTYGPSGDEYTSGSGANYHAKMTYKDPSAGFATGSGGTEWSITPISAAKDTEVTVSYDGTNGHKVKSVKYSYNDTETEADGSGNSRTFNMPAYNVTVSTELYYKLSQTGDNSDYTTKTNVYLERTLRAGGWNTFCAPFDIDDPDDVFGEGVKVKAFNGSSLSGNTLTLNFKDATSISAGTPYLIKLLGESDVNLNNKMFDGVDQNWSTHSATSDYANFVPVMSPTSLTGGDKDVLFVTDGNKLTYPNKTGNINAFRAYFLLNPVEPGGGGVREFIMKFEDEETSIRSIENGQLIIDNEGFYRLDGTRVNGKLPKGIYIHNGRKEVMK